MNAAKQPACPFVVGLTGGIGSGKSTVAELFRSLGAEIVDTDLIAHELTGANAAAMPAIARDFGSRFVAADGSLDRAAMRSLVFSDADAKRRLEAILHPRIRQRVTEAINSSSAPYVVLVVPLLVESRSYRELVDRVLVIDCEEEVQVARVMQRSQLTEDQVRSILRQQVARAARLAHADDVIDNSGPQTALFPKVRELHALYLALAQLG